MEENKKLKMDFVANDISYYIPQFKEVRGKEWIPYGISTNEYAKNLIELGENSALHGTIIQNKTLMISSEDFIKDNLDIKTKLFIEHPNKYETLHKIFYKCAYDLTMFGSFTLEVIWDKTHTKVLELYHVDNSKVLYGIENEENFIDHYFYSKDWDRYRQADYKPIRKERFNTSNERSEFLVSIPSYKSGLQYYTYPDYQQGYRAIIIDAKIMEYHNANIDNNFEAGKMITYISDDPSTEERQIIRELFEEKHTGSQNAGRTIINYSVDKDSAPIIDVLGDDGNHEKYNGLKENVLQDILISHGITSPLLVGISIPGSLGGGAELKVAQELFYKYRILPKRKSILNTFNDILRINGLNTIEIEDNRAEIMENMGQNITINSNEGNNKED